MIASRPARSSQAAALGAGLEGAVLRCSACDRVADIVVERRMRPRVRCTGPVFAAVVFADAAGVNAGLPGVPPPPPGSPGRAARTAHEILESLGIDPRNVYVTSLVRCAFARPPSALATERRMSVTEVMRPAALRCLIHLEREIATLKIDLVVAIGRTTFALLCDCWGLAPGAADTLAGRAVHCEMAGRHVRLVACALRSQDPLDRGVSG